MTRFLALVAAALMLSACTPLMVQQAGKPPLGFQGPRLEANAIVSFDGARLGLSEWDATSEPWAVIVGVHGMNDYANAFHVAAPWWAGEGITTVAYDQRGFGRSPGRGVWAGDELMMEDLRTVCALVRRKYPHERADRAQVFHHKFVAGPDAAAWRAAEAALVVGDGGDPLAGPPRRGHMEGVGVV